MRADKESNGNRKRKVYSQDDLVNAVSACERGMSWETARELFSHNPRNNNLPPRYPTSLWCDNKKTRTTARYFPIN